MWIHTLDPVLLSLGPLQIRWYGLVYAIGFLLGAWFLSRYRTVVHLERDQVWDLVLYCILGVLIGSRLFEVFWEPSYYLSNHLNFFKVWQGGMSFHGGFVGIIVAVWFYARRTKRSFLSLADLLCFPAMTALALGRVANFINGELWGKVADASVSWCVDFSQNPSVSQAPEGCRHPQQLYAAAYRVGIAGWLFFLLVKNRVKSTLSEARDVSLTSFKPGFIFWNFVLLEGVGRFIVDFWREDKMWMGITIGQWFSLVMIAVAVAVMIKTYRKEWKKIF